MFAKFLGKNYAKKTSKLSLDYTKLRVRVRCTVEINPPRASKRGEPSGKNTGMYVELYGGRTGTIFPSHKKSCYFLALRYYR
jgi:hypothetical protein